MLEYVIVFASNKETEEEFRNEINKFKKDCKVYTKTYMLERTDLYTVLKTPIEITQFFVQIEDDSIEYSDMIKRLEELKFFKMPKYNQPSFRIRKIGKDGKIGILD